MIAQLFLTALLFGILVYAWATYRQAPALGLATVAAGFAGLYFVWAPAHATWLAHHVGIGRGVDLIVYVWVVISLIMLLNLHLKLRAQMELITLLARKLALVGGAAEANAAATIGSDERKPAAPRVLPHLVTQTAIADGPR
jgi:small membrane protein